MKLASITVGVDITGLPRVRHIDMERPPTNLKGWTVTIDGPAVYLTSPESWVSDGRNQPSSTFEIPRSACILHWAGRVTTATSKHGPQTIAPEPPPQDDQGAQLGPSVPIGKPIKP